MARQIRRYGPFVVVLAVLVGVAALLVPAPRVAEATTYSSPFWSNTSPQQECAGCWCPPCPRPALWSAENVNWVTTELVFTYDLCRLRGVGGDFPISLSWRSYRSGMTQVGNGFILSFEHTVEYDELDPEDPDGNGGHQIHWRDSSGLVVTYDWDGTDYSTQDCSVHHTLTSPSSGIYKLTDKYGAEMLFDANGMPDKYTDRNGNELDFTYNSSYQITGLTDTRGGSFSFDHNADGFLSEIEIPSGQKWEFGYDTNGNLETIDTPATAQQVSGITTTISYDASDRISSIEDGRGNTVNEYTWVGSTAKIDKVTIDGADVEYTLVSGRTDRTDRNGNIHRAHHTGANITKTDMYVSSVAKYATEYTYSGGQVVTVVFPRGNRIDYTWDGSDNLTERRHKTTDTASTDASDIVHTWTYTSNFMVTYTNPMGDQTSFTRDSDGNVTKIAYPTVTDPATQTADKDITYNTYGQITQVTDEEEKVTKYHYIATTGSTWGLLEKIEVDSTGLDLETSFAYDSAGNITSITDARGNATSLQWDNLRRLTKRTAPTPLSDETKYEYDANGNLTKVEIQNKDEDGDTVTANPWITTSFTYTDEDELLTVVEEIDVSTTRTTTLAYDVGGNRIRVTKPEGNKVKWDFDERDYISKITRGETATEASEAEFAYDANGNLITVTNGRDKDTDHTYDLFDRRTKATDPIGHYAEVSLNKNGRVTRLRRYDSADVLLQERNYDYDERGRLWEISDVHKDPGTTYSNAVTEVERFKTGHVKTITNARGKDTTYEYDNAWRRTKVTDALGNKTTWTLDKNGNPTAWSIEEVVGMTSVTHEYEAGYDELNRRTSYVEIDRNDSLNRLEVQYGYDSRGNLLWRVNAEGDPTRWTFDAAGRMTKKEVALATGTTIEDFTSAVVTEWGFDKNDRMTTHKDDAGNTSTYTFDALDRVTELKYPDLEKITYVYDDADNITKTTDAAGNVIDDVYDDNNQRTSRTVTRATGFLGTTSETFTYDGAGRMTKAEDNDYKVEFTYGVIGLSSGVYEEKQSYVGGTAYTKTVKKTYDAVGNVITELYPSGLDLDRTWNDIDRLSTVTDGTNTIASYDYTGTRVNRVTFQNGAKANVSYTGFRGEVERIHHQSSGAATLVDLQYAYDDNHDRLYERFGGAGSAGDAFDYDAARRLTTAWVGSTDVTAPSSNSYTKKVEYTLDDDGNRSSVKVTPYGQSATTTTYTDNNLNQYTAVGSYTYVHDKNGNLTDDGSQKYEYDYKNQIVRIKQASTTIAEYEYDALGRRVEKDDQTNVERYIHSGNETVAVYDGSNVLVREFVFGQVIDEVLMLKQADVLDFDSDANTTESTRSFYHRNALGSVMAITDMNEAVVVSYRYDPYGSVTITRNSTTQSSDPLGNPWMYTGRFHDEESGLEYYRSRYYSAAIGRFLQRDPLGYAPGPNLYQYVSSSPTNWTDPFGLDGDDPWWKKLLSMAKHVPGLLFEASVGRTFREDPMIQGYVRLGRAASPYVKAAGEAAVHSAEAAAKSAVTAAEAWADGDLAELGKVAGGGVWGALDQVTGGGLLPHLFTNDKTFSTAAAAGRGVAAAAELVGGGVTLAKALRHGKTASSIAAGARTATIPGSGTSPGLRLVNGRRPINYKFAGRRHPSGVYFTSEGFPHFRPFARARVRLRGLTGRNKTDAAKANAAAGLPCTPEGFTWHHVEDGETMLLLPKRIHDEARHTGGAAVLRERKKLKGK